MQGIKCMIIGDTKVGKTDLFLTFTTGSPAKSYSPTVFDTFTKEVSSEEVSYNLGLWDSAGDKLYDEIRPISYPHTDCFILCYSVDDRESFRNIELKWKPEVLRFGDGPNVPIILAGLKCDLRDTSSDSDSQISSEEGLGLKSRIGALYFTECSTISGTNGQIDNLLKVIVEAAISKKAEEDKPPNPIWGFEDLKILVIGDTTVGKSSILTAYTSRKPICDIHQPTTEVTPHYQDVVLDGIEFFLGIYDLPSTPEFLHDRIKEYKKANGIIICYSINDPFSFQNVEYQWLPEIKEYCPHAQIILVGNKMDLKTDSEIMIPSVDGEELMLSTGAKAFIECSAKTLENVSEIFTTAAKVFRKTRAKCDISDIKML